MIVVQTVPRFSNLPTSVRVAVALIETVQSDDRGARITPELIKKIQRQPRRGVCSYHQ